MRSVLLPILCSIIVFGGCATASVDRAKNTAAVGTVYVETLKKVNDLALDRSITFTANLLPNLPRNVATLDGQTKAIVDRAKLIGDAHKYLDELKTYFGELDALAKGDESDATSKAFGSVLDSLKKAPVGLEISDGRKSALNGLAGFVAKQIHAVAVEKALKRDADTIAQALAVSEQMLDEQTKWIEFRERAERLLAYKTNVERPFVAGTPALGADWKKAWSEHVRMAPVIALLADAKKASAEMQKSWVSVLRGEYSFAELQASLANVKAGIEAVSALKDLK